MVASRNPEGVRLIQRPCPSGPEGSCVNPAWGNPSAEDLRGQSQQEELRSRATGWRRCTRLRRVWGWRSTSWRSPTRTRTSSPTRKPCSPLMKLWKCWQNQQTNYDPYAICKTNWISNKIVRVNINFTEKFCIFGLLKMIVSKCPNILLSNSFWQT